MSAIGDLIRQTRRERDLSQAQLAKKIGLDSTFLSRIETGKARISLRHAGSVAKALGLDTSDVVEAINQSGRPVDVEGYGKALTISSDGNVPIIGDISTGEGRYTPAQEKSLVEAPSGLKSADPNLFALRIRGNEFSPAAEDGDVLVISPARAYLPNDLVFVRTTDKRAYLGRIQFEGAQVVLNPVQLKQPKVRLKKGEIESLSRVVLRYLS